ncbi:uncharacterized protein LOC133194785 [Saccostrea echinata]|uniref:uncharacterized protein LOC133194785 n=1 Tax=Saccostrea echinata TaxID=191078 RepID=UPI002A7F79C5|nr:uncharacterized protein LOC133194785 [Saccostrea echinata]
MERKFTAAAALIYTIITFLLWLAAIATPGWFILSVVKYKSPKMEEISVELSIFYVRVCDNSKCKHLNYADLPEDSTTTTEHYPSFPETQFECMTALVICFICLLFLLNPSFSSKVKAVGVMMFIAALFELTLVIRITVANVLAEKTVHSLRTTQKDLDNFDTKIRLKTPYSVILAGIGLIFSILSMTFSAVLYSKVPRENPADQILEVLPSQSPKNFKELEEEH